MAEITYIGIRTAVSTKPVEPGKFHNLSVLDQLMARNHVRILYYFQTPPEKETGKMMKKLTESLSEMLICFPAVTGRLMKDKKGKLVVKCNDAGVRIMEAKAKGSVEEWLQKVDREKEFKLFYWEEMYSDPYFWSAFNVQLTEFEEGGLAIGLSCSHALADPICATMFIKAWADTTLAIKMVHPPFFHPLPPRRPGNKNPTHQPYTHLINYYKSIIEKPNLGGSITDTGYATIALSFTDPMVQACIAMARTDDNPDPSPFQALSGLLWTCISKAKGKLSGLIDMCVCLDMRKVLGLDEGFFGNCMIHNKVQATYYLGGEKSNLASATRAIQEVMDKMDSEGIMDLIEWLEMESKDDHLMNCDLICANLEKAKPYLATFEKKFPPARVCYYMEPNIGAGHVLVFRTSRSEGALSRMVMVTLPIDEILKLYADQFILRFLPTVLM